MSLLVTSEEINQTAENNQIKILKKKIDTQTEIEPNHGPIKCRMHTL